MTTFAIVPRGPFSLAAARDFLEGFLPASGTTRSDERGLTVAFRLDHTFEPVAVALRENEVGVIGEVTGTTDGDAAKKQVARMLSLDVDGSAWPDVGRLDPVVGALQARWPGFRAVCFASPYEAGAWGVIAQRIPMRQAARLRQALAEQQGDAVEVAGRSMAVFPSPARLATLRAFPGLAAEKLDRLRGVAKAALDGRLDADRLRGMPLEDALRELEALRGIGPWTAQHILMRGAGLADALPLAEPRVLRGIAAAYGMPKTPDEDAYRALAEAWRPYRMWVSILVVRALAGTPGWHGPEKRGKRSVAARPKPPTKPKRAPRARAKT